MSNSQIHNASDTLLVNFLFGRYPASNYCMLKYTSILKYYFILSYKTIISKLRQDYGSFKSSEMCCRADQQIA